MKEIQHNTIIAMAASLGLLAIIIKMSSWLGNVSSMTGRQATRCDDLIQQYKLDIEISRSD